MVISSDFQTATVEPDIPEETRQIVSRMSSEIPKPNSIESKNVSTTLAIKYQSNGNVESEEGKCVWSWSSEGRLPPHQQY